MWYKRRFIRILRTEVCKKLDMLVSSEVVTNTSSETGDKHIQESVVSQIRDSRLRIQAYRFRRRLCDVQHSATAGVVSLLGLWFAAIVFARSQEAAARRGYELANESYVLGVASILSLLDAQSQLLDANEAVANARYDFLEALIEAEEQMALYPFLEPKPEMTALLDRVERELDAQP